MEVPCFDLFGLGTVILKKELHLFKLVVWKLLIRVRDCLF